MKQFFRSVTVILLVGGWALASAAVYVVRTPAKMPSIILKNQLGYSDTYVDTRNWTFSEDRAHPVFVSRVLQLGRTDLLAHTVNPAIGPVDAQLAAAVAAPSVASAGGPTLGDKAKSAIDAVAAKVH